jgi:sulfatase maturation enzyme AslB (radical SAM superfamily)
MIKIKDIKKDELDEKLNKKVDDKLDKKVDEKIKPLFSCNGKCSYCIEHKCLDI